MPIIDVQLVHDGAALPPTLTQALADALGAELALEPGHVWVRLQLLPAEHYAENALPVPTAERPVFVTVLHARLPGPSSLAAEAAAIARSVAAALGRNAERVHVEYASAGAGRIAFGGKLIVRAD